MFKFRAMNDQVYFGRLIRTHSCNENYGYFEMPDGSLDAGIIIFD